MAAALKLSPRQTEAIERAAGALTECIVAGGRIFSFGASHSFMLTEELVYRTGGLMLGNPIYPHGMNLFVRPMTQTARLERVPGRQEQAPAQQQAPQAVFRSSARFRRRLPK